MKKTYIFIVYIFIISISKALMFNEWWEKSNLVTLDSDNFNDEVSQDQYTIVEFYTKWCKYCKILAPILDNLVHEVKKIENHNVKIKVARLESETNQSIAFMYGVYSFPQVFLFHKGKPIDSFDDNRELSFFVFWIKKSLPYMKRKGKVVENEKVHIRRKVNYHDHDHSQEHDHDHDHNQEHDQDHNQEHDHDHDHDHDNNQHHNHDNNQHHNQEHNQEHNHNHGHNDDDKKHKENERLEKTKSKTEDPVLKKEDISILNNQLIDIKSKINLLEYEMNSLLNEDKITSEKTVKYIFGFFIIALIVVILAVLTHLRKRKKQD